MAIPKLINKTLSLRGASKRPKATKHCPTQIQAHQQSPIQTSSPDPPNLFPSQPSNQPDLQAQSVPLDEPLFEKRVIPDITYKQSQLSYMFSRCEVTASGSGDNYEHHRKYWGIMEGHDAKQQYSFMLTECEEAISDTEAENVGWIEGNMIEGIDYTRRDVRRKIRKLKDSQCGERTNVVGRDEYHLESARVWHGI